MPNRDSVIDKKKKVIICSMIYYTLYSLDVYLGSWRSGSKSLRARVEKKHIYFAFFSKVNTKSLTNYKFYYQQQLQWKVEF